MTISQLRRLSVLAVVASLSLSFAACSGSSGGDIATVNGEGISSTEYHDKLEANPAGKQVLNSLIQGVLIDQYAKDNHVDVPESDVDKKLNEVQARYPSGQFDTILKQQGLSIDDVKTIMRRQLVIEHAVGKNVTVTDSQIAAYFQKNRSTLDQPEQVHARHILVPDLKTAQDIEAQLKSGANFADEAKKYSKDPSSKDKGGDLGFFGRKQMVPSFEQAAFSQPLNVVGQPVKSPFGYHIIEVLEHKAAQPATLANSRDAIKKTLVTQQDSMQIPVFLQGLKEKAKIDIEDPRLKEAAAAPSGPGQ